MPRPSALATRLRARTADLHKRTEEQAGIPGRVNCTEDYALLLQSMFAFHLAAEQALLDKKWAAEWERVGVTIGDHIRSHLIAEDLRALGVASAVTVGPEVAPGPDLAIASFAEALGCVYVVEGSSLGGKYIAPMIVQKVGPVPIAYYEGAGRDHPAPWRRVQRALGVFETDRGDGEAVVAGALTTFTFFGTIVSSHGLAHASG
jgi:heme oxygenase (biliverdin-IX-beta and delta-forming)